MTRFPPSCTSLSLLSIICLTVNRNRISDVCSIRCVSNQEHMGLASLLSFSKSFYALEQNRCQERVVENWSACFEGDIRELRPSKEAFDVALFLVFKPTCRLFGKGQMSLSLFRYSANVTVVLNLCDAVSNFYNLQLLMPISEDQPPDYKFTYNFTFKFLMASLEIKVTPIRTLYSCFILSVGGLAFVPLFSLVLKFT